MLLILYYHGTMGVKMTMEHEGVRKLMDSGEKFDVCVLEIFNVDAVMVRFLRYILYLFKIFSNLKQGLADHFECELISYTTFDSILWVDELTGK